MMIVWGGWQGLFFFPVFITVVSLGMVWDGGVADDSRLSEPSQDWHREPVGAGTGTSKFLFFGINLLWLDKGPRRPTLELFPSAIRQLFSLSSLSLARHTRTSPLAKNARRLVAGHHIEDNYVPQWRLFETSK